MNCLLQIIKARQGTLCLLTSGFVPFLNKKFKDSSRTFKGTFPIFSRTPFRAKKSLESISFLVLPQHEQFFNEGLSAFAGLDKVSTEIPAPTTIFKDFQGACEPCSLILIQFASLSRFSRARNFGLTEKRLHWLCFHQSYTS